MREVEGSWSRIAWEVRVRNSYIYARLKQLASLPTWFLATALLFLLFFVYSNLLATKMLLDPTLYVERLLLFCPITCFDCVLERWA